jgi:hypothetical protein
MSSRQSGEDAVPISRPRRAPLVAVALIGAALAIMPFAFNMFPKTPQGASMMAQFKPFMTTQRLDGFQTDLREINAGTQQSDTTVASYLGGGSVNRAAFDQQFPAFASFDQQWPAIDSKMTNLMDKVQDNQGNYLAIAALPSFKLFPWFFVIPGALFLAVALAALIRPRQWRASRWILVVLGAGLIAAPVAFQMFQRAPKGGQMMTAFKSIETTSNVEQIQGYFGTMADGQGAIRLDIVPALAQRGLTPRQIQQTFPAVASLDSHWVHILNDMTPMIGAMSDNVASYQALSSLPPFPLFPWFFVVPGALVAGLALGAGSSKKELVTPAELTDHLVQVPVYEGAM